MKKRVIAAALLLSLAAGINAAAYSGYCDSRAAVSLRSSYVAKLKVVGTEFDKALAEQEAETQLSELYSERLALFNEFSAEVDALEYELAPKLIDYDMLLKRLKLLYEEYRELKAGSEKCAALFRVGGCGLSEVEACAKDTESKYFEIEALLFEISALKAEIEAATGQRLTSDFDFSRAYLITDAVSLDPKALSGAVAGVTLCIPEGAERTAFETADITEQYNNAVKCYYALGSAMREYISAAESVKEGEAQLRLGALTADGYSALLKQKTSSYMTASQARADYAKALLQLDRASGGALTAGLGVSSGRAAAYGAAVSDSRSGSGLWVMANSAEGIVLTVAELPRGVSPEEGDSLTYTVHYNGRKISGGAAIPPQAYAQGCDYAVVTFYINGVSAGAYRLDVFSPFGEFIG